MLLTKNVNVNVKALTVKLRQSQEPHYSFGLSCLPSKTSATAVKADKIVDE